MLPNLSVKKPYTVGVGVIIIIILGIVSFSNMTTDLLPSIDLPYMIVSTAYPGASPEKVEESVTKPLERMLATTNGLENIRSISNENVSMVMLEFNENINMDTAMIDVNGKIDQVEGGFEEGIVSPIITKINPDMIPIMMLSVDLEDMTIEEVSHYVETQVIPEFERLEGVASVEATGLVEDQLRIQLNLEKIAILNEKIVQLMNDELNKQHETLDSAQQEIAILQKNLLEEKNKQLSNLDQIKKQLSGSISELEAMIQTTGLSKETLEMSLEEDRLIQKENEDELKFIKQQLDNLSVDDPEYLTIEYEKSALEAQNNQLSIKIELTQQALEIFDQLDMLTQKEKELENTKQLLEEQFNQANTQFTQGESELETAREQLEDAKKVAYQNAKLENQLTIDMIANLLKAQNFSMPAGYLEEELATYVIKVGDNITSLEQLNELVLFETPQLGRVRMSDVADVSISSSGTDRYTNINGNPGVILTFQKASAYSTSEVTGRIRQKIEELSQQNNTMQMTILSDQGIYIDMIIESVLNNLIYGGLLAILILIIFLRSLKTTLVVAFSIPISVLFAIVLMYFTGVTLNIISLSGLALGVGMLVDNSIVVIENIYRLRSEGVSKHEAAILGAKQVSGAIFASTLTTIGVFFPIVFATGMTQELFVDMALTIAYSLLASLIVAVTVVPALSATLLNKIVEPKEGIFRRLVTLYSVLLEKSLRYKWVVLFVVFGMFGWSIYTTLTIGTSFMPSMDTTQMSITLIAEETQTQQEIYELTQEMIDELLTIEDIETVGALEQGSMGMSGPPTQGSMTFYIILKEDKQHSNVEIEHLIYEKLQPLDVEIEVAASTMDMSALSGGGIQLVVKGEKLDQLSMIAEDLRVLLMGLEGVTDITIGTEETNNEIRIIVDKKKAISYGLTTAQIYQIVSTAIKEEENTSSIHIESKDYPVIVSRVNTLTKDNLMDYTFDATKDGETVTLRLGDLSRFENQKSLQSINRENQSRYITVSASLDSGYNIGLVSRDVEEALKSYSAPDHYTVELQGESETINEAMSDLVQMLVLAIIFVYLIMVSQFQSLRSPFIVMFTIPLAFTGGVLALLVTGNDMSVISVLGFLVLSGVIVNNGIVFVDYINQLKQQGKSQAEALVEAGKTRIRPILMTALTTILAMSTMAIGVGMGAEMTQGLAIVSIGGLIYGTILTLFVIPILYDLFNRKYRRI